VDSLFFNHPSLGKCHPHPSSSTHRDVKKVKGYCANAGDLSESFHKRGQSQTDLPPDPLQPSPSKHSVWERFEVAKRGVGEWGVWGNLCCGGNLLLLLLLSQEPRHLKHLRSGHSFKQSVAHTNSKHTPTSMNNPAA